MNSFQVSESIYTSGLFAGSSCLLWIGLSGNSRTKFKFTEEPYANQSNKKATPETYSQEKQGPKYLI